MVSQPIEQSARVRHASTLPIHAVPTRRPRRLPKVDLGDSPWRDGDLNRSVGLVMLSLVVLVVAWYGASGEDSLGGQMVWIGISAAAFVIAVLGLLSWTLTGLREVHREMYELTAAISGAVVGLPQAVDAGVATAQYAAARPGQRVYVIGAGMTQVHSPECIFVRGKAVTEVSEAEIVRLSLARCEVCLG